MEETTKQLIPYLVFQLVQMDQLLIQDQLQLSATTTKIQ